ncbi:MAG: DUF4494 domain-containing protein [Prolixibacteraceae bacterium]|nr:DUF4494 domain-containing protein [Prolixibacteraceae bacterium]
MQIWFESKVQYIKVDESGRERKVSENYILDAVSFTDAEARMIKAMQEMIRGDFSVANIKKSNIGEVFDFEEGEWWFKASINIITIDEEAGKEKKIRAYYLVRADDIEQALKRLDESLNYLVVPYIVTSVAVSTITDIIPYNPSEQVIPDNFKPLNQDS